MEQIKTSLDGYKAALIALICAVFGIGVIISNAQMNNTVGVLFGILFLLVAGFLIKGLMVIEPNYSIVLTFLVNMWVL